MNITDLKMTLGALASIGLNLANFNIWIATISGVVFLVYGTAKLYYLFKNKGK